MNDYNDLLVQPTEEQLQEMAEKFIKEGKGRPLNAIAAKVQEIKRKKRMALVKLNHSSLIIQRKKAREEMARRFLEEFIKNGGKGTEAVITITGTKNIRAASQMGTRLLKEARGIARIYLERKGYGYGKMLDVATDKMEKSKTPEWWDRLMKMADYEDFISKPKDAPSVVNIVQTQKDLQKQFGFEGDIIDGDTEQEV